MTAVHMQITPSLEPPASEDAMELSPDMDRQFPQDEDIDIDLEPTGEQQQDGEDENMSEDVIAIPEQELSDGSNVNTANDDEMIDDEYAEEVTGEDEPANDEDILDAESTGPNVDSNAILNDFEHHSEHQDQLNEDSQIGDGHHQHQADYDQELPRDEEQIEDHQSEEQHISNGGSQFSAGIPLDGQEQQEMAEVAESDLATQVLSQGLETAPDTRVGPEHAQKESLTRTDGGKPLPAPEAIIEQLGFPEKLTALTKEEQDAEYPVGQGESVFETHTYIHPIVIIYQDNEMSLFPPIEQGQEHSEIFFLQDEQLAGENIKTLLGACRSVLGESIGEQDELVVSIDDLGLHISESAVDASNNTLAQLIDVYVQLQHHDGVDNPPPLYINLYTTVRFSYRVEFLLNAIVEGKGLSHVRPSELAEDGEAQDLLDQSTERQGNNDPINLLNRSDTDERQDEEDSHKHNVTSSDGAVLPSPTAASEFVSGVLGPNVGLLTEDQRTANGDAEIARSSGSTTIAPSAGRNEHNMATKTSDPAKGTGNPSADDNGSQAEKQPLADDDDFIDYEDDEELAHGSSAGSSTLQGDVVGSSNIPLQTPEDKSALTQVEHPASEHFSEIAPTPSLDVSAAHMEQGNTEEDIVYKAADDVEHENGQDWKQDAESNVDDLDKPILAPQEELIKDPETVKATEALGNPNTISSHHDSDEEYNADQTSAQSVGRSSYGDDEQKDPVDHVHSGYNEDNQRSDVDEDYAQEDDHETPDDSNGALGDQADEFADGVGEDDIPGKLNETSLTGDLTGDKAVEKTKMEALGNTTDQLEDDSDEITYEDDEDGAESLKHSNVEQMNMSSPGSLKRPRSDSKVGHLTDVDLQGAKRIRST